ncbi:hypothetical protein BMS3Abin02_00066 [bacterium BMS3Abin02]|nr:hypothetical protein BMS3Abin02_00066 [bacterium BMS3Abin02]
MMHLRIAIVAVALVVGGCAGTDTAPSSTAPPSTIAISSTSSTSASGEQTSPTRWGFVPFPAGPNQQSVGEAFRFVAAEGDLVAFHFDDGIPWEGLLADSDLPPAFVGEMASLKAFSAENPQLAVYVATAITNQTRNAIAGSWRAGDPPLSVAGRSFADPKVREGIRRWVRYLADEFEPNWFNLAVEINMYETTRPEDYPNLVSLYRELYEEVKAAHPDTVVFASFQMELGDPGAAGDLVDALDIVGISTYPYLTGDGFPPEDYLDSVADLGLPLAVAETGYPAAALPTLAGKQTFSPSDQAAYVEWLGRRAASPGLVFVTWFFPTDITAWIDPLPAAEQDVPRLFEFLGMRTADGTARPALEVWRRLASP